MCVFDSLTARDIATASGSRRRSQLRSVGARSASGHLLQFGLPAPKKEVPTLKEFAPRFMGRTRTREPAETERHRREGNAASRSPAPVLWTQAARRDHERRRAAV